MMPATINPTTGDPCDRVFAAFGAPCELCEGTGVITIDDDDGHDSGYRSELVPCPECEMGDDAAWWAELDAAVEDGDNAPY